MTTMMTEPSVQPLPPMVDLPVKRKGGRPKGSVNKMKYAPAKERIESSEPPKPTETPEQRRANLLLELAALNQSAPAQSNLPSGPNYWSMNHTQLKTLCVSRGILDRTGQREPMIQQLQNDDLKQGLQPHMPDSGPRVLAGLQPGNTPVHAEPNTADSIRIIDADGNEYAMVYRVGKRIMGNPVVMDMEGNARKIVAALNQGRM